VNVLSALSIRAIFTEGSPPTIVVGEIATSNREIPWEANAELLDLRLIARVALCDSGSWHGARGFGPAASCLRSDNRLTDRENCSADRLRRSASAAGSLRRATRRKTPRRSPAARACCSRNQRVHQNPVTVVTPSVPLPGAKYRSCQTERKGEWIAEAWSQRDENTQYRHDRHFLAEQRKPSRRHQGGMGCRAQGAAGARKGPDAPA
jgi:hypothetical protein